MKSEPYKQFISRYAHDIGAVLSMFHELNYIYNNQFIISLDSDSWELTDLRANRVIFTFPFKKCIDFRYGFDEYFVTNRNLINYIINGEINKAKNLASRY